MVSTESRQDRARRIQADGIVLDALFVPVLTPALIGKLRTGGVTTVHTTVALHENFRGLAERLAPWYRVLDTHRDEVVRVTSVRDIRRARAAGRIGLVFGVQNATVLEDDLRLLPAIRDLGIRIVQLTYNERNLVGDGCAERTDAGLSDFGVALVREMNRLRLLIDLSHVGERTSRDAIELSEAPVVATHSNARTRCDYPRNLSDEVLKALGARGGVVGINAFPGFVSARPGVEQTVEDYLDHVVYVGDLIGRDKVGIGLDLRLVKESVGIMDRQQRGAAYRKAVAYTVQDAAGIWLWDAKYLFGINRRLKVTPHSGDWHPIVASEIDFAQ